jgi:galactokinase
MMTTQLETSSSRQETLADTFHEHFGADPELFARAPGRVDLMGSHTDYNLGYVLTLPINRDTWMAVRARSDQHVRLYSVNLSAGTEFVLGDSQHDPGQTWSNYVRGVAAELKEEGCDLRGFDGVIHSTVPISSGLSSSAALECAAATVFEALGGWKLDPLKKAQICQRAENQFVGVNCGILDQYTSCAGREGCALLLDCRDLSSTPIKVDPEVRVIICDTKHRRELAGSEYGKRRNQCEEGARWFKARALREVSFEEFAAREKELPAEVARRSRFILEEHLRVPVLAEALTVFDKPVIRQLTAASFRGARELYEITAPPMEVMMKAMLAAPGIVGARQAGAGFGGCMVAFVDRGSVGAFAESVRREYHSVTGVQPAVYAVEAAAGASWHPPSAFDPAST